MNHLAHCYLSFGNEDVLLGNFIGDFVKGNNWQEYPPAVQKGLLLHRAIDAEIDTHPHLSVSRARIRAFAGRYSGPFCDILFDHILTLRWEQYHENSLAEFCATTYQQLHNRREEMPAFMQARLPKMIEGNFLYGYTHQAGMAFVLERFSKRLPVVTDWEGVLDCFWSNLADFEQDFDVIFPDIVAMTKEKLSIQ